MPYYEMFIGMALLLMNLVKIIHSHGRNCKGELRVRRSEITLKRFSLCMRFTCTLNCNCSEWKDGVYRWKSSSEVELSPGKFIPTLDVLYAIAITITPNSMAHSDQLFSAMLITPPSRNILKKIINVLVDPYLRKEKDRLISETCDKIRLSGVSPILCMGVGHSSARNSQAATLAAACGSLLVFTLTDTMSNAWAKEALLVGKALSKAIDEQKLDVSMVEIDDNHQNAGLITACRRVNGPEEMRDEPVKCAIDVFHAVKSLGKNAMKLSAEHLKKLDVYFKDCCTKEVDASAVVDLLDKALVKKADVFFHDILEFFSSCGAEEWRDASNCPVSMNTFAKERKVLDVQYNGTVWDPVITAWNSTMKVTKAIQHEGIQHEG